MKFLKTGLSLALVGAGIAFVPGSPSAAVSSAPQAADDPSLVRQMKVDATGTVRTATQHATGKLSFIRATGRTGDLLPSADGSGKTAAIAKADAYLTDYAPAFGAASDQLKESGVQTSGPGWTIDYTQVYKGVEVFGSKIRAHVDRAGDLTSVNGYAAPGLDLSVTPALSTSEAAAKAVSIVRAAPPGAAVGRASTAGIEAASTDLMIYRQGSTRGIDGKAVLTYVVEVTNHRSVRDMLFLDAATGKTVNRYSMMTDALDRELYEASIDDNGTPDDPSDDTVRKDLVWKEGDAFPGSLDIDQQNEVLSTGESYWLYKNTFGRDSYDGEGAKMITVNNDPGIACPNANWNGQTTNYCSGVTSDDTVSHEWGHAYTEYTSGLVYQWQPGAMNEAYSDIWGETVDMVNDRYNETPNTLRTAGTCSKYTRGPIAMTINSPADIAGPCDAAAAEFGPIFDDTGVTTDVVVGQDDASDGSPTNGCEPFTNAAAISGKFVYVDRGECAFTDKIDNAETAGATGIVIGQNSADPPFAVSGESDIYGVMVDQATGTRIKAATDTVNVTIKAAGTAPTDDSYRWLSGESDPAFGGAIRDMWNPTCYGDPGKVSDAEFQCSTDDSGGVHSNSGIVNHTFALLVDGGTYNGVTVPAIGLDKAANLFWKTQTDYLFPIAEFADLADGLDASCADLTGQAINKVDVTPDAGPTPLGDMITAADCAAVKAAADAVELRRDPTQCGFKPLLKKGAPSLCGKGFKTKVSFKETFEHGLKGWTRGEKVAFDGAHGLPWKTVTDARAPGRHRTNVAFGPDPSDLGQCDGSPEDISSVNWIRSPSFKVPTGKTPRMSFQHYVATEFGYDGGNVKVSVAGKKFKVIPASAYIFNKPGATLEPAPGNTSPIAGEVAFTGTDGGEPTGSWGTSRINLAKVAKRGQKIRIRFDMGRDGCGGIDGWYLDNIKVAACKKIKHGHTGHHGRKPTTAGE